MKNFSIPVLIIMVTFFALPALGSQGLIESVFDQKCSDVPAIKILNLWENQLIIADGDSDNGNGQGPGPNAGGFGPGDGDGECDGDGPGPGDGDCDGDGDGPNGP